MFDNCSKVRNFFQKWPHNVQKKRRGNNE